MTVGREDVSSSDRRFRPRVCLLSQQVGHIRSGVGSYTAELLGQLVASGCAVTLVSPPDGNVSDGVVRHIPVTPPRWDPTPGGWIGLSRIFRRLFRPGGELDPSGFDVIHFTDAREALGMPPCDTPVVGTVHDSYAAEVVANPFYYRSRYRDGFQRYAYYRLARFLERRAYGRLDRLLANTAYVADSIVPTYRLDRRRVEVVPLGIAPPAPAAIGPPLEGDPAVLFVGSNFFRKGLPALARAVALLSRGDLPRLKVHVVGKDRNQRGIAKLLLRLGVAERFRFHGWVDRSRTLELFPRAGITCVPSLVEAFGLVYLESMMAGTPVIAGNRGGTVEFIEHERSGMLVDPETPEEIASALRRLATDGDLRERIVTHGREVAARFTARSMGKETLRVYRGLVAGAGRVDPDPVSHGSDRLDPPLPV